MKAIIFGATGQDGSHLADLLVEKGYEAIGVSRRSSVDNTQRIKHLEGASNFSVVQGDITDAHSVIGILQDNDDVDEIYNLAAQSHVGISFKQPGLTWDITGKGCINILQSIVDLNMLDAKFYQASSSEMFGDSYDVDPIDKSKYQNEDTRFLPQSPYAIAKCAAHYTTRLFREAYGLHASAGILFNHEGPRRGENFVTRKITKWIGEFVRSGKDENFPQLRLGNLEAYRDWGYAGDYVEAMWLMLQQEEPDDYVICTGKTYTIRDFLDYAFNYVGIKDWSSFVVVDPKFYRPSEVDYLRGDCSKAKNKLDWEPKYGIEDLVNIMMEHDLDGTV
jgi:GDPmannose 4,6-dehydratase